MLISFIENPSRPLWIGIAISVLMFIVSLVQSFVSAFHNLVFSKKNWDVMVLFLILSLCCILLERGFQSLFQILHQYFDKMFMLGTNIRSVLTTAVYIKVKLHIFRFVFCYFKQSFDRFIISLRIFSSFGAHTHDKIQQLFACFLLITHHNVFTLVFYKLLKDHCKKRICCPSSKCVQRECS